MPCRLASLGETVDVAVCRADEALVLRCAKVLEQILHSSLAPVVNGWQLTYHVFDDEPVLDGRSVLPAIERS